MLTGRVSLRSHPWLADHAVAGVALLPGTAFVELAVRAGDQVGCASVEELTLEAPLALRRARRRPAGRRRRRRPGRDAARWPSTPDPTSRTASAWTRHASGCLAPEAADAGQPLTAVAARAAPSRST